MRHEETNHDDMNMYKNIHTYIHNISMKWIQDVKDKYKMKIWKLRHKKFVQNYSDVL